MSSTASGSIERRDAAVAAALTAAVVVVLGYASGVGIRTSSETVAMQQPPALQAPAPQVEATTTPPALVAQSPILTGVAPAPPRAHEHPRPVTPHDHAPTEPSPTPAPQPEPAPTACRPGVLEALPVAGPVAGPVVGAASRLLFRVLSTTPLLPDLAPVTCTLGELVGPSCCSPATTAHPRAEPGP